MQLSALPRVTRHFVKNLPLITLRPVGQLEHIEEHVAVGQWHNRDLEHAAIGEDRLNLALCAVGRNHPDHFAKDCYLSGFFQMPRQQGQKFI